MKRIVTEQKDTISIKDIRTDKYYVIVKVNNRLLNYTDRGLTYLVGGEPYEKEISLKELIEGGAEAYQFEDKLEVTEWIKENLDV